MRKWFSLRANLYATVAVVCCIGTTLFRGISTAWMTVAYKTNRNFILYLLLWLLNADPTARTNTWMEQTNKPVCGAMYANVI